MFRRLTTFTAVLALVCESAWGQTATLRIHPSVVVGSPGGIVNVPVWISSPDHVNIIRFTLDYNTSAATFLSAQVGVDGQAAGFTIPALNPNLPFPPTSPDTNDNVLILLMTSSSGWITGNNKELVVLRFALATGACKTSPLTFDPDCNHTDGTVFDGSNAYELCASASPGQPANLNLISGAIANGCASDALAEPLGLRLHQNTPNPFNPTTQLAFEIPFDGPATLEIMDVAGHRVRTLVSGNLTAGTHSSVWDGRSDSGSRAAAGVYYARLQTPEASTSRSLVLVQ